MDKRQFSKCAVGLVCTAVLAGAILQANECFRLHGFQPMVVQAQENTNRATDSVGIINEIRSGTRGPLYGAYFRTWHDKAATKSEEAARDAQGNIQKQEVNQNFGRPNTISEVPSDVDMLFIFEDWTHKDSPFWRKLKDEYIPKMHAQGTIVIQTIGVKELSGKAGLSKEVYKEDTEESNKALAKALVEKYVYDRGVDGLDIDVELGDYNVRTDATVTEKAEIIRANKVFKEIATLIGKTGKDTNKMLILDTTLGVEHHTILKENAKSLDFVLRQYYGAQGPTSDMHRKINEDWKGYSSYITPRQFMIGFAFYEENADLNNNFWNDIKDYDPSNPESGKDISGTRAESYTKWQPTGGLKGGMFAYAIDRDGVGHPKKTEGKDPSDEIVKTDYTVSKKLKAELLKNKDYTLIDKTDFPDPVLLQAVKEQVSPYRGDLSKYDKELKLTGEITNLEGLEKLTKLSSLEMDGLTNLTTLNAQDLPKSIRDTGNLKLSNMSGLEKLELSNSMLQSLEELGIESMTNLMKFDLSHNKFDFEGDKERLEHLIAVVKKNNLSANNSDTVFEGQKPSGYLPESYEITEVTVPADGTPYNIFEDAVFGSVTKSNFFIGNSDEFEVYKTKTVDGRTFVDQNWTYKDFSAKYDKHTVVSFTSTLKEETNRSLGTSIDESYNVYVYNGKQKVHQMKVHVGQGKTFMENLALGAKVLGASPDMRGVIRNVFDGDKNTTYRSFSENGIILADLGNLCLVRHWRIFNPETGIGGNLIENRIKEATILVPKDPYMTDISKLKSEDWVEVANITNGKLIEENPVNVLTRYCKLDIKKTYNGYSPYLSEFQILGWKINDEQYLSALKEAKEAKETATTELSEVTIKAFEQAVEEAKKRLEAGELDQAGIDAVVTKLSDLTNGLKAQVENKKAAYDIQANYRTLMNTVKTLEYDNGIFKKIAFLQKEMMTLDSQIDEKLGELVCDDTLDDLVSEMKAKMTAVADLLGLTLNDKFEVETVVEPEAATEKVRETENSETSSVETATETE
ncbi:MULTISPECIES: EndoS/ChiA family endoglycosidase [Streptococcus]|uniref:mannosyl-glycoprotein endo-beta-N-acetylglucosaminidase n=1 Tax=Streptococcus caledonicus TaxID=2614158 RepID=A0ABW0UCP7_9STRE|nr:hypothetical protein [Streptococcus sp. S784/96/1]